jgi:hypothetical protein
MNKSLRNRIATGITLAIVFSIGPATQAAGVAVGSSTLIGTLDYSDTFTGTDAGGRPSRPFVPAVQPPEAYIVENSYGKPSISFDPREGLVLRQTATVFRVS